MDTKTNAHTEAVDRMFEAGAHYGLAKARRHPSAKKNLFGTKHQTDVFDLSKTAEYLEKAKEFAKNLGAERKTLLLVGGKPETHKIVRDAALLTGTPYCVGRWIGGTITNFPEIKKRVARLEKLVADRESGALAKYTKFERLQIDREITKLQSMYEGLIPLNEKLPHALFVIDPRREIIAVKEAAGKRIPVIALANSDCDLSEVTYPIPANDAAPKSIAYFVNEIVSSYKAGLESAPKPTAETRPMHRNA